MKTVQLPDTYRVLLWKTIKNYLDAPQDKACRKALVDQLKKYVFPAAEQAKTEKDIEDTLLNEAYLTQIMTDLNAALSASVKIIPEYSSATRTLQETQQKLEQVINSSTNDDVKQAAMFLNNLSLASLARWKSIDEEQPDWYEYTIFQIIEGYAQFLTYTKPISKELPQLDLFYKLYSEVTGRSVCPLYFEADEENIVIEPNVFPDSHLIELLSAGNIKLDTPGSGFIFNALGERFIEDKFLFSLYTHEFGHFIDRTYLGLSDVVINKMITETPQVMSFISAESYQWVSELIADTFAIVMSGPSYLFAMIDYLEHDEILFPSVYHPGVAFRTKVLYNYLLQNEFVNLFTPEVFAELQTALHYYNNNYNPQHTNYFRYEKVLENYLAFIYRNVLDFLQNAGCYSSYDKIASTVCQYGGNLENTREQYPAKIDNLQDILFMSNIDWLLKLNDEGFKVSGK